MTLHKRAHDVVHAGLASAPDPVSGAVAGAAGGAVLGTAAAAASIHGAGVTAVGIGAAIHTVGLAATAGALGTLAAPVVIPAVVCCAGYGALHGLANWCRERIK